ncbi:MAG: alpha/beta hydrolase [Candidatus Omnitrophica bacterium]|nr:alpha/beta hydrolase [Candidatus Omnitrophota bacterium]
MPVFFVHGEKDWVVKPWHSKILHANAASPAKIAFIKNGPHAEYLIRDNQAEMLDLIKDWLEETLRFS